MTDVGLGTRRGRVLRLVAAFVAALALGHVALVRWTRIEPPTLAETPPASVVSRGDGLATVGRSYTRVRSGVREVRLEGAPTDIGRAHGTLLRDRMIANETVLWGEFRRYVPLAPVRALLLDVGRVRYRDVASEFPAARRDEVAAEALAFRPDPFDGELPTYHRMVFLHALYDIALSFERSPLIGCSAVGLGPSMTADGHPLFLRAFDFEAGEIFDRDKAVYLVRGKGVLPFASVAWPGLSGVLTGMNSEGVVLAVNGARAGEPRTHGVPVVFALREVLENAHDTREAIAILSRQTVMVSHLVLVGDAHGTFAVVERAPGEPAWVRPSPADADRVPVTNHFVGPLAVDPRNLRVLRDTTTKARAARLDEVLATLPKGSVSPARAVGLLRDHECAGGTRCALGDRRAIDALIATHGVVADTQAKVLWVSRGPHLSGAFVRFDVARLLADDYDPTSDPVDPKDDIDADPILGTAAYDDGVKRAGSPKIGGDAR
ncbi:MAG: C45 family peptidase [Polyangiaceae bacterium]